MDRASELFRQMEERFIELTWMWDEVQGLVQQQRSNQMKVIVTVQVLNDDGSEFSTTTNANNGLEKAEAVAMRGAVVAGLTKVYADLGQAAK